jgi:hypothetical protein
MVMNTPAAEKAIAAFTSNVAEATALLAHLTNFANDHMGVAPEQVNWAHVGDSGRLLESLREVSETFRLARKPEIPPAGTGYKGRFSLASRLRRLGIGESVVIPAQKRTAVPSAAKHLNIQCVTRSFGSENEVTVIRSA